MSVICYELCFIASPLHISLRCFFTFFFIIYSLFFPPCSLLVDAIQVYCVHSFFRVFILMAWKNFAAKKRIHTENAGEYALSEWVSKWASESMDSNQLHWMHNLLVWKDFLHRLWLAIIGSGSCFILAFSEGNFPPKYEKWETKIPNKNETSSMALVRLEMCSNEMNYCCLLLSNHMCLSNNFNCKYLKYR